MTLFHLREFWTTNLGNDEEFDKCSICVSNIDNEPDGFGKCGCGMKFISIYCHCSFM